MSRAGWRTLRRWARLRALRAGAWLWRRLMLRTTVVAITGSVGKTTTKECLAAVLASRAPTLATRRNENDDTGVPRTLLRLRPWHRFAVIEIGTAGPGQLRPNARLVRPDVAVVLRLAVTHTDGFQTLDATAAEKSALPAALSRRGLAILNAGDERVRAMAGVCRGRVETFGPPGSDAWADDVSARWPARLSLRVHTSSGTQRIDTQLVGEQWVGAILAAVLAARALGVAPAEAVSPLAAVEPFTVRMQPVRLPNGAVVIRDEHGSSPDTWQAALAVLREARARRRVLIASDLSDVRRKHRVRYRMLGEYAAASADAALFVGEHARFAVRSAIENGMDPARVEGVLDVRTAAARLATFLEPGDVALLKGRNSHHLSRILYAQYGEIRCWKTRCGRRIACDVCPELRSGFVLRTAPAGVGPAPDP